MNVSTPPPVQCNACGFAWNSPAMVDGLRLIGSCPKCGTGALVFRDTAASPADPVPSGVDDRAPHTVLGVPRR